MTNKTKKDKKGFTIIELLVVVLIIGLLSAIALPQYFRALDKARFVQVLLFTEGIARAEQSYFLLNNEYTTNIAALDVDIPSIENSSCRFDDYGGTRTNVLCYLYKNKKRFIALERNFTTGSVFCITYAETDFKGDDLCKSIMNTTTHIKETSSWREYKKPN